jgi:hypothetical protein
MLTNHQMTALILRAMNSVENAQDQPNMQGYHGFLMMQTDLYNDDDGLGPLLAERPELIYDKNKTYVVEHGST